MPFILRYKIQNENYPTKSGYVIIFDPDNINNHYFLPDELKIKPKDYYEKDTFIDRKQEELGYYNTKEIIKQIIQRDDIYPENEEIDILDQQYYDKITNKQIEIAPRIFKKNLCGITDRGNFLKGIDAVRYIKDKSKKEFEKETVKIEYECIPITKIGEHTNYHLLSNMIPITSQN